jgi:malate dehydrogenase
VIYGMPVTTEGGTWTLVKELDIDTFSREKMDATLKELLEEQDGVKHLLS